MAYLKLSTEGKDWQEVTRVKEKLNLMIMEDAMGIVVRSRFKQNVQFEKASLFHTGRELKNAKCSLEKLKIGGADTMDQNLIEDEVVNFFTALFNGHHDTDLEDTGCSFQPDNHHLADLLQHLQSLDPADSEDLHRDITMDELDSVISSCASNKSPGLDGITYEFYKTTWHIIKDTFMSIVQCQLNTLLSVQVTIGSVSAFVPNRRNAIT